MNIYQLLTKKADDRLFYEAGILNEEGRLTSEGQRTVLDLIFQGNDMKEVREKILSEIKKYKKDSGWCVCTNAKVDIQTKNAGGENYLGFGNGNHFYRKLYCSEFTTKVFSNRNSDL